MSQEFRSSQHPRLQTIKKLLHESHQSSESQNFVRSINLTRPDTEEDRNHIVDQLSKLINGLSIGAQTPQLNNHGNSQTRSQLMSPFLWTMCATLLKCWGCLHQHKAVLPLFTYKKEFPDTDTLPFTIFLNREHPPHQWQETCVMVAGQS